MSIWTHVAGIVRIDDIRFLGETNWTEYFGKEVHFSSPKDVWEDYDEHPEGYLPVGSEGGLYSSLWVNPDEHSMAAYTLMIFGDLRDYVTPEKIIEWFKEKLSGIPVVRQAVITVETEGLESVVYNYEEEK